MAFKLVYYSQQDPQWKEDKLGFGTGSQDTIGYVGCALTSVAMLLSGYGFTVTPKGLNDGMKAVEGFIGDLIRWDRINKVVPQVTLKTNIKCETSDAPLGEVDAALAAGRPVVVRVDGQASPGLQWHYVMIYAKKGADYLILDPWPYQPGTEKEDLLMARYGRGNPLQRAIQHVLIFEASGVGTGPITPPAVSATPASAASSGGFQVTVKPSVGKQGAKILAEANKHARPVGSAQAKEVLNVLEDKGTAKDKIGKGGKMIHVRSASTGLEGYVDGEFVKAVDSSSPKVRME